MWKSILIVLLILCSRELGAQVFPRDKDTLNYTSILFSFPWVENTNNYLIEVEALGERPVNFLYALNSNKKVLDGFVFGTPYRWRYRAEEGEMKEWSPYRSFYIGDSPYIDTAYYHYRGKRKKRGQGEPGLLFFDYGRIATNRAGAAYFFLPDFPFVRPQSLVRDLKMTNRGTLTALLDSNACEFDLDGNILWRAPDDGKISGEGRERYHHNLTRLENGNYLVLGTDQVSRKAPDGTSMEVDFGTIIEYKPDGTIAWSWNSKDYFSDKDLFCRKGRDGLYDVKNHLHAMTRDGRYVYAGFRDISRIVVIEKKTGKVIASYGGYGYPSEPHSATGFFRRQHDATRLSDGNLAVVNNDSVMDPNVVSSLVIFSPISADWPQSEKVFEFPFNYDTLFNGKSVKTGNLTEMRNGNLLVNMGTIPRCFEVTRKGDLIWDLSIERYDTNHRMWLPFPQYRVSFSSSLYPYEMTGRVTSDSWEKDMRKISVKVWNVGSESDTYTVRLKAPKDQPQITHKTKQIDIPPGESLEITFSVRVEDALEVELTGAHCRYPLYMSVESSAGER